MDPTRAIRIGRLGSTTFLLHPSLLLAGAVLVVLFAPRFAAGGANPYLVGVVFVAALYTSVLLHELAHVVAALAHGMRVPSVTLHLLGGETRIAGESRSPLQEGTTAVVGPVVSALLGLAAFGALGTVDDATTQQVLWSLGWINVLVAAFNLLPGLPLDGGHALAALGWAVSGRRSTGTLWTAYVGGGAAAVVLVGVVSFRLGEPRGLFDVAVGVLVAGFLAVGARDAVALAAQQRHDETGRNGS